MSTVHVVTGAGPVGSTVALQLADAGQRVRLLTRSGSGPVHPLVERHRVDVSRPEELGDAFAGAVAVHHCIHGSAYDARVWRAELLRAERVVLEAAGRVGAVVVFPESLYAYGPVTEVITEVTPRTARTGKLGVRTELLAQRDASPTPTVSVAASDFYGPLVRNAHAGERMVPTVLAGRTMRVLGSPDQPHSFTYVPDLAAAMITAAAREDLWDSFLHAPTAPAPTQRRLVEMVAEAAGVRTPRVASVPVPVLGAAGLLSRRVREMAETGYMFARPFVMDSTASERRLGLAPTPLAEGVARTVAWWREEQHAAA
ncbi:NAD-dependent epimerase/dehydratase family protein [Nocardioides sp. zg-1228]|uniref:NAD-dependent epimerase/dehydratase family protein n=1 Tax=Nocardioides sp. zg-1228 TaxID=2763008 RepID=UPI001642A890|nr:NAD-dependent epimerase/dehydratase family protein [Nocardioides sp. zg-1228]MBC2933789.1 NAD-dependent epimerase/dehydratase family protein [Nocardioides sp. zg-1228]QSF58565.1 NAD-dependent epimerase/dehydratase family protein [Nocardioides sp. zg-1228]